ncbi:MAG: molybdenum cofactor biosynthesis protein MoaE [Burkholderiaceae bacterium]|nr:molybdenum cofactor biosynthesis protein MoaE [Burkholderiaceae bacterium]
MGEVRGDQGFMNCSISVQTEDFDVGAEIDALTAGRADIGAVVSFVGYVREFSLQKGVTALELEHYPGMTERSLEAIARRAMMRWPLTGVRLIHRHGRLLPSERIVAVLTASAHRQAAFEANAFIMDYLKSEAPFWKKEHRGQEAVWVQVRESDAQALARWA